VALSVFSFASPHADGETGNAVGVCAPAVPVPAGGLLASFRRLCFLPFPDKSPPTIAPKLRSPLHLIHRPNENGLASVAGRGHFCSIRFLSPQLSPGETIAGNRRAPFGVRRVLLTGTINGHKKGEGTVNTLTHKSRQTSVAEERLIRLCVNAKRCQRLRFLRINSSQTTMGRLSGAMIRV
jgi:hypothetical protein